VLVQVDVLDADRDVGRQELHESGVAEQQDDSRSADDDPERRQGEMGEAHAGETGRPSVDARRSVSLVDPGQGCADGAGADEDEPCRRGVGRDECFLQCQSPGGDGREHGDGRGGADQEMRQRVDLALKPQQRQRQEERDRQRHKSSPRQGQQEGNHGRHDQKGGQHHGYRTEGPCGRRRADQDDRDQVGRIRIGVLEDGGQALAVGVDHDRVAINRMLGTPQMLPVEPSPQRGVSEPVHHAE